MNNTQSVWQPQSGITLSPEICEIALKDKVYITYLSTTQTSIHCFTSI